ncbi:hypothetical protein MMC17_003074 [Xylographa soralifera]|nr:hypothetical protein [Xylographa soralifera]
MTDLRQLRKRKDGGTTTQKPSQLSNASDIPLSMPAREAGKHKTLFDIAAERQAELQGGRPFASPSDADLKPEIVTTTINRDGTLSVPEGSVPEGNLVGPLGEALFYTTTLTMLHFTLDVLVHQQYRQEIGWNMIAQRTAITFPILAVLVYIFHSRASAIWAQVMFLGLSVAAGCYVIYSSNVESYFAVMKRAPPLGTLWVWSVIEMRLELALLSVVAVVGYFWWVGPLPGQHTQQLALAVNLVKSKPATASVKEYVHNLRQSLVSDSAMSASSELMGLRDEVRKLRDENKGLRDENKDLREENKILRQQHQPISAQGCSSRPNNKRKRTLTDVLATPIEPGAAFILDDLEIYLPSAEVDFYLRNLDNLQQLLAKQDGSAADIVSVMVRLPSDIVTIIGQVRSPAGQLPTTLTGNGSTRSQQKLTGQCRQQLKDNASRIQVISRTWPLLLKGLDQLVARRANNAAIDRVISAIIECFPPIIATILEHTELSIYTSIDIESDRSYTGRLGDNLTSTSATDLATKSTHYHLCRLYLLMMATLDIEESRHRVIMDSAMSFLLKLAGVVLEAFVFDIEHSPFVHRPKLLLRDKSDKEPGPLVVSSVSMEAIAPSLIWVLERALVLLRRLRRTLAELDTIPAAVDRPLSAPVRKRYALSDQDKARLQSTMMHVVFPDDNTNFEDRLREPLDSDIQIDIPIPIVATTDVRNWYKQELWRILAWDVVAKAIEWD